MVKAPEAYMHYKTSSESPKSVYRLLQPPCAINFVPVGACNLRGERPQRGGGCGLFRHAPRARQLGTCAVRWVYEVGSGEARHLAKLYLGSGGEHV